YVSCINHTGQHHNGHYFKIVPTNLWPEIPFLIMRFNNQGLEPDKNEDCFVIETNQSRKKFCGRLLQATCNVVFNIFVPKDRTECEYILFTSHGTHTHPPPPGRRTPQELIAGLMSVISRINDPALTTNGLLKNPALREFCLQHQGKSLIDVHKSFANMDKVSVLIYKQRLLSYPEGQDIAGVEHEFKTRHLGNPDAYIQRIYNDGANILIFCFFKQQAKLLLQLESYECEMGFKRLYNSEEKEIVFTTFSQEHGKVITLARVLVNRESVVLYERMFSMFFDTVSKLFEVPILWFHIHGRGFRAMVMDMDTKQMPGFGRYLSGIDPQRRHWQWHVKHAVVYCTIHFQHGVERAVGIGTRRPTSLWHRMISLQHCQSAEEYMTLCDLLMNDKVQGWARHKRHPIIASGLNKYCSDVDPEIWDKLRKNTNATEQTHYKSDSMGRRLSLLRAIHYGEILDRRDYQQEAVRTWHGIGHTYRSTALTTRYEEANRRESKLSLIHYHCITNIFLKRLSLKENFRQGRSGDVTMMTTTFLTFYQRQHLLV
ncbi:uncharacterized protein BDZ99DRAFT_387971, partial [Mytilinidion resinicola]